MIKPTKPIQAIENSISWKYLIIAFSAIFFPAAAGILFVAFVNNSLAAVVIVCFLLLGFYLWLLHASSNRFSSFVVRFTHYYKDLSMGNLPAPPQTSVPMLQVLLEHQNRLVSELNNVKLFFVEIGKGHFDNNVKVFNDGGELGLTLSGVKTELKKVAEEDRQRNWANEGLSRLGELLRKESDLQALSDNILSHLIKYIGANQGYLFIVNDEAEGETFLELTSAYAFSKKKYLQKRVMKGEGLAGQAWIEGETIYLKEIPEGYVSITSGLGDAAPRNIAIVPLKNDAGIQGVLELASFRWFQPFELAFIEKIAESIAVTIANGKTVAKTNRLLDETNTMTSQLRAQEEIMRQNMEEMSATQEEMARKQSAMDEHERMINSILKSTPGAVYRSHTDKNWTMIYISPKVQQLLGYTPEEFTSQKVHLATITHPDDVKYVENEVYQAIRQYRQYELNYRLIHKNGNVVRVWEIGEAIYDSDGRDQFIEGLIMDVTKDYELKKEAEEKQALLQHYANDDDNGLLGINTGYEITFLDEQLQERFKSLGITLQLGSQLASLDIKEGLPDWKTGFAKALAGEKHVEHLTFNSSKWLFVFSPVKGANGTVMGAYMVEKPQKGE